MFKNNKKLPEWFQGVLSKRGESRGKRGTLRESWGMWRGEERRKHVLTCNASIKFFCYSPLTLPTPQFSIAASYVLEVLLHYSELWSIHLQALPYHRWFCAHDASPYMRWVWSLPCLDMIFKVDFRVFARRA